MNCPAVSDLRLLRTWVKLTLKIARMLGGSQELQRGGGLFEDRAAYLRERLAALKVTKMDQVVQMYLFQCMLNVFPDDEPEAWHSQVDDACRVMLLSAYLGVDSVDVIFYLSFSSAVANTMMVGVFALWNVFGQLFGIS